MADLRRFEIFLVKKAHFPTFIPYLIAIKSFNKYINRARKVGIWPKAKIHSTSRWKCQDFLPKVLPFSFKLCYTIRATQSQSSRKGTNEMSKERKHFLPKQFSLNDLNILDCVATMRVDTFSVRLSLWGRTFLMPSERMG